jgi:hypothetical protein
MKPLRRQRSDQRRAAPASPAIQRRANAQHSEYGMRKTPDNDDSPTTHPRWVQWLIDRPPWVYLFAAVLVAALIIAFVLWLDESTLSLVAGVCFLGILVLWALKLGREWRDAETVARVIAVLGFLILLGASASNFARYLLLK